MTAADDTISSTVISRLLPRAMMIDDMPHITNVEEEVERRLDGLRSDPDKMRRYDFDQDETLDEEDLEELRRLLTVEVQTEVQRHGAARESTDPPPPFHEVLLDRFEVLDVLGRGAQGRTYRGRDRQTQSQVAIKELLLRDVEDWKAIELFEREGRALKFLDHPGIPAYVDAFHLDEGGSERFFLVQEFVDGTDYETLIDEGLTTTEEEAKQFLEALLEILSYLQNRSPPVIHRDIKPSNIMRRRDGSVALIDFGAVQSVIPNKMGGSTIIGTSGYMPIEQLMGRAEPATDVFATGVTTIHLLSRRHPADLPMSKLRLEFGDFVNISDSFTGYLEEMTAPHVENRFPNAETALQALRSLDRPARIPMGGNARRSTSPPPRGTAPPPTKRTAPRRKKQSPPPSESPPRPSRPERPGSSQPVKSSPTPAIYLEPRRRGLRSLFPDLSSVFGEKWWQSETFITIVFVNFMIFSIGGILGVAFCMTARDMDMEYQCVEAENGSACVEWGLEVERTGDLAKAERIYEMGCDLDDGRACSNQAIMALRRDALDEAVDPMHKGCLLGTDTACSNLSALLFNENPKMARWGAERACEMESPLGCANYASHFLRDYVEERDGGDLRSAWRYAQRGCDGDSESGCYRLALAELYLQDLSAARRAAMRAVDLNDGHPFSHKTLGITLVLDGDVDAAMDSFADAAHAASNPGGDERALLDKPVDHYIVDRLLSLQHYYPEQRPQILDAVSRLE